ncbi:MAG: DUF3488 and transglutaminase-like domain-containing protein [Acidiferrobacterales bacterium]|nr:DUF3488 and transglutaminase-like domain-containing protein [Acidiferrobacterales bacterium]
MSNQELVSKPSFLRSSLARFNINLPPLPTAPPAHEPNQSTILLLGVLIGLAVTVHFAIADLKVALFALLIFVVKIVLVSNKNSNRRTPPPILIILLTILSIGIIITFYGGWNGQKAGISFLVLLVSLKFLESRGLRDYYVTCLILYFLAASSFLFNSSIANILSILIYALAITAILLKLSSPTPINWRSTISTSSSILTKALPLALILFFFFPRIHGSFGFLPSQDQSLSDSELSNSLVAGDIANSAFNNALAFRVEFEGRIPPNSQLYWRSKVMPTEQNFSWEVGQPSARAAGNAKEKLPKLKQLAEQTNLTKYTILHEDSTDLFLPYLEYAVEFSSGRFNDDYSIWHRPRSGSFSYSGESIVANRIIETSTLNTDRLRETTSSPSARIQALLTQWKQKSSDPLALAQQILEHFNKNEFYYSLYPPGLGDFPVDEFLFNTKTGYCEHYASLFTILMRWLDVPARVVVGYQGGAANQSGEYLEIRYSDAHAWSEILVDQTWVRVDPTAAISPERIEFGMDAFMSLWDSAGASGFSSYALSNYLNPTGVDRYYRMLRDSWNNVGYQWKKWVVDYDADTQRELLAKLGINGSNRYGVLVLIMFASIGAILLFYFWRLMPKPIQRSKEQQLYLKFVNRLKNKELSKSPADTPLEFAQKAIQRYPEKQKEILEITNAYVQLRYGKSPFELNQFKQLVKQFRLSS